MKVIYKITYPNGKIYIGKDSTNSVSYFGSPDSNEVAKDFDPNLTDTMTVTKTIIERFNVITEADLIRKEIGWIIKMGSNNPDIGYNRNPKWLG